MDGITNAAYRILVQHIFEKYNKKDTLRMRTEFMNAEGYVRQPQRLVHHLVKTEYEQQTVAQIYGGSHEDLIATAKDIMAKYPGFCGVELNIGCPSPKIMACGGGAGMMKERPRTLALIKQLSEIVAPLPFSIKTRAGLSVEDKEEQQKFIVEAAQYCDAITIHGRTYKQCHSGEVDREYIYKVKEIVGDKVKIFGNGGIRSYEDAVAHVGNLDGILIGQAAIGDPWILTPHTPTVQDRYEISLLHLKLIIIAFDYYWKNLNFTDKFPQPSYEQRMAEVNDFDISRYSSEKSVIEYRKYLFNYVNGLVGNRDFKNTVATIKEYQPLVDAINEYFQPLLAAEQA